ncbi:MAG: UDP-N-acetylglucosamine 1-carboxyvinyltransferase [Candidatus Pacebacteria bacterium]|nr:UDP-N-acetylglucosamine 1-carboxyvinyltransferase [Candidatus Paceibacterota bacterium]
MINSVMMKRDKFIIQGLGNKKSLSGKIRVNGAKNAVLPVMASSVLFKDGFKIKNVPLIEDLNRLDEIFKGLGVEMIKQLDGEYFINTTKINSVEIEEEASKRMRASIIFTGPILARFGELIFPHPGGCVIGARPIDLFLEGFEKMGAKVKHNDGKYFIKTKDGKLKGTKIFFKIPSVTATETFIMAGILAEGKTILKNVAIEPEIISLIEWLNDCGAKIKGVGTPVLEIEGGSLLEANDKVYETIPDRLEAGSFLILGALCASDLEISNCNPSHLEIVIEMLKDSGVDIEVGKDYLKVNNKNLKNYKSFSIKTHEYPGFPTDLQSPTVVFLTQSQGESLVFETIFEGRLNYTSDLVKMGADIKMWDSHRATIKGPKQLKGCELEGPDIRTGFAFVIAALVAEKESIITNVYYIDRGYGSIEKRLFKIGADIKRVKE